MPGPPSNPERKALSAAFLPVCIKFIPGEAFSACGDAFPKGMQLRHSVPRPIGLRDYGNESGNGFASARDGDFLPILDPIDKTAQPVFRVEQSDRFHCT